MYRILKFSALLLFLLAGTFIAKAVISSFNPPVKQKEKSETNGTENNIKDKTKDLLLQKMLKVCAPMNPGQEECFFAGVLSMSDKVSPEDALKNIEYVYSKKGENFYYQLGSTETINANGLFLYIDHEGKIITISDQKQVVENTSLGSFTEMLEGLNTDEYTVNSEIHGTIQTLRFLNENSADCKEYKVSFDTVSLQPKYVYSRIGYPDPYEDAAKDKTIQIHLKAVKAKSDIEKYISKPIVVKAGQSWKPVKAYADYKLIYQ